MARANEERRRQIEARILRLTRSRLMKLGEIAKALKIQHNTIRAKYLYPMAHEGF